MNYIQEYLKLLIVQYSTKPKAKAEISTLLSQWDTIYNLFNSFETEFDIDSARGKQLDIIGKIVGLNRKVDEVIAKKYFGFDSNINSYGFQNKQIPVLAYPFKRKWETGYTTLELNDTDYRLFLKAKISKNFANSDIISINEIVMFLFDDKAYVSDNNNMTLTLYIDRSVDIDKVRAIQNLNLLPTPQAVRYNDIVISYIDGNTFGFSNNPNNLGFGSRFDTDRIGGLFARKLI